jgi:hypothetical protein
VATKYWVGGAGNWSDQANHWSLTSGGAGGGGTPTAADDVVVNAASGTGNITINTGAVCRSFNGTGATMGLASGGAFNLTVGDASGGALTFAATMGTVSGINGLVFNSSSTNGGAGWAVTTGGKTMPNTVFGAAGRWVLQDAWTSGANITLNVGTLDTNGKAVTAAKLVATGTGVRSLILGASQVTLTGSTLALDFTVTTNLTFTPGTSTITFSGSASNPNTGGRAFNNVVFTGGGNTTIAGGITAANVTYTGTNSTRDVFTVGATIVSGALTITGNSVINRVYWSATGGVRQSATCGAVVLTNVDIVDRNLAGAAAGSGGTSLGNGGNNVGIVFDAPQTNYWVGNGGNYSDITHWASSSGGAASSGRVPLPQDPVIFDNNSFTTTGQTVALNLPRLGGDWTWNVINSPAFSVPANVQVFGSVSVVGLRSIPSWSGSFTLSGRTASYTFNPNALGGWSTTVFDSVNGAYTLLSNFITVGSLSVPSGGFDANGFNVQAASFNSSGASTRNLDMGTGIWTLTASTGVWSTAVTTGLTFSGTQATIVLSNVNAGIRTWAGGGLAHGTIVFTAAPAGSSLVISGNNNSFAGLTVGAGLILTFPSGTTTTVGAFNVSGAAGSLVTVNSSTAGTTATVSKTGGVASSDYLSIQDITATGGAIWYAGANSTNVSNNSGWLFIAGPTAATARGFLAMMG